MRLAGVIDSTVFISDLATAANPAYGGTAPVTTVNQLVGGVVGAVLGLLGIIFLILIIYSGMLWMTAQGETKQVTKARDILVESVIGLIIVLSAYAISAYVGGLIGTATGVAL